MYKLLISVLLSLSVLVPAIAQAELVVVGNPSVKTQLTRRQLIDIYLGKATVLPSGDSAVLFEYGSGHPLNNELYQLVIKRTENQILMNRQKQLVSGKFKAPTVVTDQSDLLKRVAATPNAIGYIDIQYVDDSVVVLYRPEPEALVGRTVSF